MLWIARSRGLKTVHSEHWSGLLPENEGSIRGIERTLMRWYFHRINRVLPVSEPLAAGIQSVAPKTLAQVLPNIVSDVPESEPQAFASTSFCCVGDVVFDIKRQDQILEVFKQMPRMRSELHFYGGGPDLERLQALAKHTPNVHVHGRITNDQVLEILPAHHAHILFSKFETFGITTLEARKAGLWAITGPDFGSASYADDYTRFASDSTSLLSAMQAILEEQPAPKNSYPKLRSSAIGSEIIGVYQELKS
jgi:glycosyltransferase involved in cell wall biosynthesis